MNGVRLAITSFMLVLLVIVAMGFVWTASHQPPAARIASHIVLGISGFSGIFALVKIWRPRQSGSASRRS